MPAAYTPSGETAHPHRVSGYDLALPPGWVRLPTRNGEERVRAVIDRAVADLPRDDRAPARAALQGALHRELAGARAAGALDVYLPVSGPATAASFVVSHLGPADLPGGGEGAGGPGMTGDELPAQVLAALLDPDEGGDVAPASVAGGPAVRRRRVLPAVVGGEDLGVSTRVDYIVPIPGSPGWLLLDFSTVATAAGTDADEGDPAALLTAALEELFDAMVSTLRWRRDEPSTADSPA